MSGFVDKQAAYEKQREKELLDMQRERQRHYDIGHHAFCLLHQFNVAASGWESNASVVVLRAKAYSSGSIMRSKLCDPNSVEREIIEHLKPIWDSAQLSDAGNFFLTVKFTANIKYPTQVLIEVLLNSKNAESIADLRMFMKLCGTDNTELDFTS